MKKTKVLFFYPNEFLGPEMTVYTQIIRHLDLSRFTPYVILNSGAEGECNLSEEDGVILQRWKFGRALRGGTLGALRSGMSLPGSFLSLARYARHESIDIVQCSAAPRAGTLGLLLARLSGARLLLHYHVLPGRYGGPRGFLESTILRKADSAVAVSEFLAGKVRNIGAPSATIHAVANGVDCLRFHPDVDGLALRQEYGIAPGAPLILQLARIIQQKRQEDVVRAFAIARRQVPDLRCLIVGWEDPRYEGPFPSYKAELQHIASQEGLGDSLIIADARPEAPELVAAADMVVMPSIGDAWNLAVTEAMAGGRAVIGSLSGGIPEQIVDGVNGFLVQPESPHALAEKMVVLARDIELRQRMGRMARHYAETYFSETRLAEGFEPIYEGLAQKHRPLKSVAPVRVTSQ